MFRFEDFFSCKEFPHMSLFEGCSFVWEALLRLNFYLTSYTHQIEIPLLSTVFLRNSAQISIGKNTEIDPGVLIEGPCIIGQNCHIGHGAYIRPNTVVGNDCSIGHAAEVKGSILFNKAKVTHFTYVGDSILGQDTNLGAGVKCANLRLDQKLIKVRFEGEVFETGLRKFGAIVGDGCGVGCNSVLNPGTLLWPSTFVFPLSSIQGVHGNKKSFRAH